MFNFYYHIPSAMTEGKWNLVQHTMNNDKHAAARAVVIHYRGSEYPSEVEVWVKRKARTAPNGAPPKVKKFMARETGKWIYDITRIPEAAEVKA